MATDKLAEGNTRLSAIPVTWKSCDPATRSVA